MTSAVRRATHRDTVDALLTFAALALVCLALGPGCDGVSSDWDVDRALAWVVVAIAVAILGIALLVMTRREGRGPWDDDDDEAGA